MEINCNKCGFEMNNLGNISGILFLTKPDQWDEVYICDKCKEKITVRVSGDYSSFRSDVSEYKEQK